MPLFNNIREKSGKAKVKRVLKNQSRKAKVVNYSQAKSIGVVYQIKDADYQFFIKNYIDYLREEIGFKSIKTLGYFNEKEPPHFLDAGNKYRSFNNKDLKWNFIPKDEAITEFMDNQFDILIDFTDDFCVPVKYIVAKSNAYFKIGRYKDELKDFYDFMINLKPEANLKQYTDQINHYLSIINK